MLELVEPFLDFYREHDVAPVHYRSSEDFTHRRLHLYAKLGIPPALIREGKVLEFGPGTGDNARVTADLKPKKYVLVEANPRSISETTRSLEGGGGDELNFVEVIESRVQDFVSPERFSVVIAENIVPGQRQSTLFASHILNFVEPGGVAIFTTHTEAGLLADMCRQLLRPEIRRRVSAKCSSTAEAKFSDSVKLGVELFSNDLDSLGPDTRSAADWAVDNVLHDWIDRERTFTPRQALAALPSDYDFLASSPTFGADSRWFKQVTKKSPKSMTLFVETLDKNIPALLDYRVAIGTKMGDPDEAMAILSKLFELRDEIIAADEYSHLSEFLDALQFLSELLPEESEETRHAIQEFADASKGISGYVKGGPKPQWPSFAKWWGRATIYLSVWRLP